MDALSYRASNKIIFIRTYMGKCVTCYTCYTRMVAVQAGHRHATNGGPPNIHQFKQMKYSEHAARGWRGCRMRHLNTNGVP